MAGDPILSVPPATVTHVSSEDRPHAANGLPRAWHPFRSHSGEDLILKELSAAILATGPSGIAPTRSEIEVRLGEIKSLVRAAERGELLDQDWCPVSRDPALWELRWQWSGQEMLMRSYFHEPTMPSHQTVVAKVHLKDIVLGDDEATRQLQNQQIDVASRRISFGRPHRWGLDTTPPIFPATPS